MIIGRIPERHALDATVSAARLGLSGVLVLTGEPGVGKSALLGHVKRRADGMRVLTVTGNPVERDLPYAGLTQLLRLSPVDLAALPGPQADALGTALTLRSGGRADALAVGAALVTLLTRWSEVRPLCLIVDDAHLVDVDSQRTLGFLARRLVADAICIVAAARTGEPCALVADDLPQLELSGLDLADTRELMLAGVEGAARDVDALTAQIHRITGGNPLGVLELTRQRDLIRSLPADGIITLPATLTCLYVDRLAAVSDGCRTALLVAAAAGADPVLLGRACHALVVEPGVLVEAEAVGLVTWSGSTMAFVHPLARSGVYAAAEPADRRRVHAAIAACLGDADADRRAWHRSEACVGPDEETAADLDRLAGRASGRGAYPVAAAAGVRAARLTPVTASLDVLTGRLTEAARWSWQAGDASAARDLLDEIDRLDDSPGSRWRTRVTRGLISARMGPVVEGRETLMVAGTECTDPVEAIGCFAGVVSCCVYSGDAQHALAAAIQIEARLTGVSDGVVALGSIASGMGRVLAGEDGRASIQRGMDWFRRRADPVADLARDLRSSAAEAAAHLVLAQLFLRDAGGGRELVQRIVQSVRDRSDVGALPHLLFYLARDEATTDRWLSAEADYTEAIAIARELGQSTALASALAGLSWLEARLGRSDDVRTHAGEAEQLIATSETRLCTIWVRYARGDDAYAAGRPEEAIAHYVGVGDHLTRLGIRDVDLSPAPELVEAWLAVGGGPDLAQLTAEYERRAESKGHPWACARAARMRGLLALDDSDRWFGTALELHAATADVFELARTQLAYGRRLRRDRRRVDARGPLRAALDQFAQLDAQPWATMAADELAATGETVGRPGQGPAGRLTPRELQIVMLLVDGNTTRQAASALFVSPKTVEYHLRHVYTKLDIDSRSALIELLGPHRVVHVG